MNFVRAMDSESAVASFEAKRFLQYALIVANVQKPFGLANKRIIKELSTLPEVNDNSALKCLIE
jgi:hypothetical protein